MAMEAPRMEQVKNLTTGKVGVFVKSSGYRVIVDATSPRTLHLPTGSVFVRVESGNKMEMQEWLLSDGLEVFA